MCSVNATAAYCRATLITPHDYLRTMGNLKTVEGTTVAGLSNKGRKSGLRRSRAFKCREARSVTLAHLPRSRWTHKHRRFANLSVLPSKSSSASQNPRILHLANFHRPRSTSRPNYITGLRRQSSSTSTRHRNPHQHRASRGVLK